MKTIIMTAEEIFKDEGIYIGKETIGGVDCSLAYIQKFKWSWAATQLNVYIIIGQTNANINKNTIESFSHDCYEYAIRNNKGWPRGLQSGVGSIAILKGDSIDSSALDYCQKTLKKHWAAFEVPVIYDITNGRCTRFINNPIWGKFYFPYFAKLIDKITEKLGES